MKPLAIQSKGDFFRILEATKQRTNMLLSATNWDLLLTIKRQVDFIEECVNANRRPTEYEAGRINLGLIAVRNFEDSDPEYASCLKELDYAFLDNWDALK